MEGQPFSVDERELPVEKKGPLPNPTEGAGTGPFKTSLFCLLLARSRTFLPNIHYHFFFIFINMIVLIDDGLVCRADNQQLKVVGQLAPLPPWFPCPW